MSSKTKSYSRSSSRASIGSTGLGSSNTTGRPPVILRFEGEFSIAGGFAGSASPKHIFELPQPMDFVTEPPPTSPHIAQIYFQRYAATVEKLLLTLGGGAPTRTSRVLVLHTDWIVNRHWTLAVTRILQDVCRVTAVHFQSVLAVIPLALPSTTSSPITLLTVHLSYTGFQCMVYAEHHLLEYTYQSSEYYYYAPTTNDEQLQQHPRTVGDLRTLQKQSIHLLITALCLCLQQCPVSVRKAAIHSILLSGNVVVDNFGITVAKKLRDYLLSSSNGDDDDEAKETKEEHDDKPNTTTIVYTSMPVNKNVLKPLASHIGVLQSNICEQLAWIGASRWAQE